MLKFFRFSLMIAMVTALFTITPAEAGTLTFTFLDKETDTPLQYGYVYLRSLAMKEKYFAREGAASANPDYIFGVTNASGVFNATVKDGTYYLRVTRRKNATSTNHGGLRFGPPEPGDYSYTPYLPVTISAGVTTDLSTIYADRLGGAVITGVITSSSGQALAGRYVKAQTEQCMTLLADGQINQCGPVKLLAEEKTDLAGNYRLVIRDPGDYYIVTSQAIGQGEYYGNVPSTGWSVGPITVGGGARLTQDIQVPSGY